MEENNFILSSFTDVFAEEISNSQPISLSSKSKDSITDAETESVPSGPTVCRPAKRTGQHGEFRSIDEIDKKYRDVFSYPFFNLVQSKVIEDALYSDKSLVVCAPTGSGKTVVFEMAIVQLLMEMEDKQYKDDFKIIYMAPVKALCTERLTEWYPKFTKLGLHCIEVTGDTDVDFSQLKPYRIIITTPEKWDILTRRWTDYRALVEVIKLFLIDEVHILNDELRGPVLEAVVSRMKTIEASSQSAYRIEQLQKQYQGTAHNVQLNTKHPPSIRFVAVSATVSNPEDVAEWLGTGEKKAVFHKFGDECRPVKLKRIVEGYPCADGTSIFKFDIILNYKLWPIIQKYYDGKPTLIFCNTRKSVMLTAETLAKELTVSFKPEQRAKLASIASAIKNKKIQMLVANGVGCHHAGLLYEERTSIEQAFRQRDLPILITTTTLAMGVNLPAHLVIIKNTQQYVNGGYQEYSISTVLQMVGRAGRPQFDTEATAVIMTRSQDKLRYQSLVGGSEPLQSFLHKRLTENLNSEAALRTVTDVAQCVQWLRSTFLYVRAAREPKRYLGLPQGAPDHHILKKIEELCVKAMNGLATAGLITMDEACCIESTTAGKLMSVYYLDFETMKLIMKIEGSENLEQLLLLICESHELADMHLRVDERRCLNTLNRNNGAATIRFPMKGKINTRQMKVNCIIQAVLGCLPIPEPSLNQEALKIMRVADRVCRCLVAYMTRQDLISNQPKYFSAVFNSILLAKCIVAHLWENSPYVSKQLRGIGPAFSTLLAAAGKVNFMLLAESHPRDLERIMNKAPPAGNILHKQILNLPKYQIVLTPVDEISVTVQLLLLNQHYLSENMDHLTAGDNHKFYIVVGDSENYILVLNSFKDTDLISVFDGCIQFNVTRRHRFEHKIVVHCVSVTLAGIDVQADYLFKDLDPVNTNTRVAPTQIEKTPKAKTNLKQTSIKDTFKERKRKASDLDISQSKEKKKRDNSILEKFRYLKESFIKVTNEIKDDMHKASNINIHVDSNERKISENTFPSTSKVVTDLPKHNPGTMHPDTEIIDDSDYEMDDGKFDSIMNEIESEINKKHGNVFFQEVKDVTEHQAKAKDNKSCLDSSRKHYMQPKETPQPKSHNIYDVCKISRNKSIKKKPDNYRFIEIIDKNTDLTAEDNKQEKITDHGIGFSDSIKNEIQRFLQKAHANVMTKNTDVEQALLSPEGEKASKNNHEVKNNDTNDCSIIWSDPINELNEISYSNTLGENRKPILDTNEKTNEDILSIKNATTHEIEGQKEENDCKIISSLPDVILVHGHNKSNLNTQNKVTENGDFSSKQDVNLNEYEDISSDAQKAEHEITPKTQQPHSDSLNQIGPFVEATNKINEFQESQICNEFLSAIQDNTVKNQMITQRDLVQSQYGQLKVRDNNDDVLMLSDKTREDLNAMSQDFNKITLTEYANTNYANNLEEVTGREGNIISSHDKHSTLCEYFKNMNETTTSSHTQHANESMPNDMEYTKKYSYTKTKIDICTQKRDSKKCIFKTIQKMKIDFDITKIVSTEHEDSPNINIREIDCPKFNESYIQNNSVTKTPVFQRKPSQDRVIIELAKRPFTSALALSKVPVIKSESVYRRKETPKSETVDRTNFTPKQQQLTMASSNKLAENVRTSELEVEHKNRLHTDSQNEEDSHFNDLTDSKLIVAYIKNPINVEEHDTLKTECGSKLTDVSRSSESESTSIDSILQKYAKVLKEKSVPAQVIHDNSQQSSKTEHTFKPKRTFKIKDIHKVRAQLPSSITKDVTPAIEPKFVSEDNVMLDTSKAYEPVYKSTNEIKELYSTKLILPEIEESVYPEVEENDDAMFSNSQVDNSMFDPKMLLEQYYQSTFDDNMREDYVSPPPQFCDEKLYSPSQDINNEMDGLTSPVNILDNITYEDADECYNTEIFENVMDNFDVTKSEALQTNKQQKTEIETWTLSKEEDLMESNYPSDFLYSEQTKNSDYRNTSRGKILSTRDQLGQFKFNKSKFTAQRRF